jgi:hypothetical protein
MDLKDEQCNMRDSVPIQDWRFSDKMGRVAHTQGDKKVLYRKQDVTERRRLHQGDIRTSFPEQYH